MPSASDTIHFQEVWRGHTHIAYDQTTQHTLSLWRCDAVDPVVRLYFNITIDSILSVLNHRRVAHVNACLHSALLFCARAKSQNPSQDRFVGVITVTFFANTCSDFKDRKYYSRWYIWILKKKLRTYVAAFMVSLDIRASVWCISNDLASGSPPAIVTTIETYRGVHLSMWILNFAYRTFC